MTDFSFVGFDIRMWPWSGTLNVDDTGWDLNEEVMTGVCAKFGIQENEYQLLMPQDSMEMEEISDYILNIPNANIAAVQIPTYIAKLNDKRTGYRTSMNKIDLTRYIFRGFDVCDIDGFFSGLHNPEIGRNNSSLFSSSDYLGALEAAMILNFIDREHSPFSVIKVFTLK